jgi:hypothetical protein
MTKYIFKILVVTLITNSIYSQSCRSILEVSTNKESALIFINENFIGYGKIRMDVDLGKFYITIKEKLALWNEDEINDSVSIKDCDKEYLISFNHFDKTYVDSKPQNAAVYIYDSLMAYTPNFINVNQFLTLKFKKNGTEKIVQSNDLLNNSTVSLDFTPDKRNESFTDSKWFKILLGSAAVLGSTAAYFKIKADNLYEDYLFTKNKSLVEEIDRYDLYSGIAFGLLQINFGYLIYQFLIE